MPVDYSKFDKIEDPDEESLMEQAIKCKSKGNESFKSKSYDEAVTAYRDGIDKLNAQVRTEKDAMSDEEKKLRCDLHSNLSAAYLKSDKAKRAMEEADAALKVDPEHIKSYYRKAQALKSLGKHKEGYRALLRLQLLDASNKSAKKLMKVLKKSLHSRTCDAIRESVEKEQREKKRKEMEKQREAAKKKKRQDNEVGQTTSSSSPSSSTSSRASTKSTSSNLTESSSAEIVDDPGLMRGYKKKSDGRTTSYFDREVDESAKKLIGDCTPKPIQDASRTNIDSAEKVGSAWNAAGTYEEKDRTPWAKARLESLLKNCTCGCDDVATRVTEVKKLEGEASHTFMRGRRRYIFEFSFDLKFEVVVNAKKTYKGTLKYVEFASDDIEEPGSVEVKLKGPTGQDESLIRAQARLLQREVLKAVAQFNEDFKGIE
eukprot:g3163.t1